MSAFELNKIKKMLDKGFLKQFFIFFLISGSFAFLDFSSHVHARTALLGTRQAVSQSARQVDVRPQRQSSSATSTSSRPAGVSTLRHLEPNRAARLNASFNRVVKNPIAPGRTSGGRELSIAEMIKSNQVATENMVLAARAESRSLGVQLSPAQMAQLTDPVRMISAPYVYFKNPPQSLELSFSNFFTISTNALRGLFGYSPTLLTPPIAYVQREGIYQLLTKDLRDQDIDLPTRRFDEVQVLAGVMFLYVNLELYRPGLIFNNSDIMGNVVSVATAIFELDQAKSLANSKLYPALESLYTWNLHEKVHALPSKVQSHVEKALESLPLALVVLAKLNNLSYRIHQTTPNLTSQQIYSGESMIPLSEEATYNESAVRLFLRGLSSSDLSALPTQVSEVPEYLETITSASASALLKIIKVAVDGKVGPVAAQNLKNFTQNVASLHSRSFTDGDASSVARVDQELRILGRSENGPGDMEAQHAENGSSDMEALQPPTISSFEESMEAHKQTAGCEV